MERDSQDWVRISRCENDGQGGSRLSESTLALHEKNIVEGGHPLLATWAERALSVKFVQIPAGVTDSDWHPAPCLQYVIVLNGRVRVEVSEGGIRDLRPGDVILAADTDGVGHRATVTEGPARLMFVSLAESSAIFNEF